ncbi:MAG TPA: fibronectin type III domain-containing protein, partial [Acidobacteriota bacterium]|nr:fibronectin type III domain-containing protein [Acidobacteriota bacterium]
ARKVRVKQGINCFELISASCSASADPVPDVGDPAQLVDNWYGDPEDVYDANWVAWNAVGADAEIVLKIDLGAELPIKHGMLSFVSKSLATPQVMLPATVQFAYSTDDVTYHNIGDAFDLSEYKNSRTGQQYLAWFTDCDKTARYIRATITNISEENEIELDEFSIWGGTTTTFVGEYTITGYLGDSIDTYSKEGVIQVQFEDVTRKEADNRRVELTLEYKDRRPEEIIYDLLTNESYWSSAAPTGPNLVTDPGFELGTAHGGGGWEFGGGASRKSNLARTGTYCAELDWDDETIHEHNILVTAGEDYLLNVWIYSPPVASRDWHMSLTFNDGSSTVILSPATGTYSLGSTSYCRVACRFTAPAGATAITTFLLYKDTGGDGDWRVDDISIRLIESTATIPYDSVLDSSEIGWAHDANLSGFSIATWQGQNGSILDYINELAELIGFVYDADGDGVRWFREPEFNRTTAHTYLNFFGARQITGPRRTRSGKDIRNSITIVGYESGNKEVPYPFRHEASIAKYGVKYARITEPLVQTSDAAEYLAKALLRDFAYAGNSLESDIVADFDIDRPYRIYSHHEGIRAHLKEASHGNAELWALMSYETEMVTSGQGYYRAHLVGRKYMSAQPGPAANLVAVGADGQITVSWDANLEADMDGYSVYWASGDDPDLWNFSTVWADDEESSQVIPGLSNGTAYWIYVRAHNIDGIYSERSAIIRCLAGGGNSGSEEDTWGIADLSAALTDKDPSVTLDLSWTPVLTINPDYIIASLAGPFTSGSPTMLTEHAKITPQDGIAQHYYSTYRKSHFKAAIDYYWRLAMKEVVINDTHYHFGSRLYSNDASAEWPT